VGSLGLPDELTLFSKKIKTIFGFPDKLLGAHIERAYQALALNETRRDFVSDGSSSEEFGFMSNYRIARSSSKPSTEEPKNKF
jgi:hypothetical protein